MVFNCVLNALFIVFGMVLLKLLLRREWTAVLVAILLFTFTASRGLSDVGSRAVNLSSIFLFISIIVLTAQRLGLLAMVVLFFVEFMFSGAAITLDPSQLVLRRLAAADPDPDSPRLLRLLRIARRGAAARTQILD